MIILEIGHRSFAFNNEEDALATLKLLNKSTHIETHYLTTPSFRKVATHVNHEISLTISDTTVVTDEELASLQTEKAPATAA